MNQLATSAASRPREMLALETLRVEHTVPMALQRIRPLNVTMGIDWHELLIRPEGADPGAVITFAESLHCAAEVDLIIASRGLRLTRGLAGRMSLNVSGQSVSDKTFLHRLVRVLEAAEFPYTRLVLEITETARITDYRSAVFFAEWMREAGAWIALDDVTDPRTTLPLSCLDVIKVDRALVSTCATSDEYRSLLRALAETARNAAVLTVAEGVEHQTQLAVIASLGYSYYQGFLQDLPVPLS